MNEGLLTNREIATLVVLGLGLVLVAFQTRGTDRIWPSIRGLFWALLQWKLLLPLLLYVVSVSAVVCGAARIGLWSPDLWKPTLFWLVTGFGLLFRFSEAITEPGFFRRVLVRTVGLVAFVEYVVNFSSFPLWVEIPTQALAALMFSIVAVTGEDSKHVPVRKLANGYLGALGLSAMVWTVWRVAREWQDIDIGALVWEFLVPIWLTPPTLVFVYLVAVWAAYETTFTRMRFTAEGRNLFTQKLAVVLRTAGRPSVLRLLRTRSWHIGRAAGFWDAWTGVEEVLHQERDRVAAERAQQRRLIENVGRVGVDASGRELDQREHRETKKALQTLASWQFGHYRNNGDRYETDIEVEHLAELKGLPIPSGIRIYVDQDGQRWYAERRTITGHWFAIGAAGPPTDQWMYDGPQPPTDYPNEAEWDHSVGGNNAPNWD